MLIEGPDSPIYEAVMDDSDEHIGQGSKRRRRYYSYPYPQRLNVLSDILRVHILREKGEIGRYLELQGQVNALCPERERRKDKGTIMMMLWLDEHLKALKTTTVEPDVFVINVASWGREYTQKMLDFNFKTLMSRGNLPTLVIEKKVILYIQADHESKKMIEEAEITKAMKAIGVMFDFAIIPDSLIEYLDDQDLSYWMLGTGASLALEYAKSLHACFHHSYPDIIYSDKFFSELLRLACPKDPSIKPHKSILGPGMRSDECLLIPALAPYTTDKCISVPSADLMAHHMNCLHIVSWPYVVNNAPRKWEYPDSHVILWETEDHIHFCSPHVNILWLDYSVIKDLPPRFYMTMDSEMDLIVKGEDFYMPREVDQLYMCELSAPDRAHIQDDYSHAGDSAMTVWKRIRYRDVLKFFLRGMKVKLNRDIRPKAENVFTNDIAKVRRHFLFNMLMSTDPHIGTNIDRTHEGREFK